MLEDDLPAKKTTPPRNLEPMSIDELTAYITALGDEIERAQAEIKKKEAYKSAAAGFFKQ